jgi:hypothetical protein
LIVEGGIFLSGLPGQGGGFDLDPFEANSAVRVTEHAIAIPAGGFQDIAITLTRTGGPEAGLNHLVATFTDAQGRTGALSPILILKLVP